MFGCPQHAPLDLSLAEAPIICETCSDGAETISVMTLNIVHGRGKDANWYTQQVSKTAAEDNLDLIVDIIELRKPDIVALQEADGPSDWSGNFDHIKYLAENSILNHHFRGKHRITEKLDYGTAIISKYEFTDTNDVPFNESSIFPKGFVHTKIQAPNGQPINIISLHLHPYRRDIQRKQLDALVTAFSSLDEHLIIMGDFNLNGLPLLFAFTEQKLNLKTFRLENPSWYQATFDRYDEKGERNEKAKRLDWIFISEELEFQEYEVIEQKVSDHYAVFATIVLPFP